MTISQWTTLMSQGLLSRASAEDIAADFQRRSGQNGKQIFKALLECRQSICIPNDPLPPRYLESLLMSGLVTVSDVLVVLISKWNDIVRSSKPFSNSEADISSLQQLTLLLASKLLIDKADTRRSLLLSSRWLTILVRALSNPSDSLIPPHTESVGTLFTTLCATIVGVEILSEKETKTSKVVETVRSTVDFVIGTFPALSDALIQRLGAVQKHLAMFDEVQQDQSSIQALQIQANIPEMPLSASRVGTMMYLEAMIFTARTVDDTIVFNFLAGRHNNEWTAMFIDLLLASFQLFRKSHDDNQKVIRFPQTQLFIRNKLPSILATISGSSFGVISSAQAITSAWEQIKSDLNKEELLDTGRRFLHICSLHQLISPESVSQLIGDQEIKMPTVLHSKEDFISQVNTNHSRVNKIITELIEADGSAAVISQAIVEIIMGYCQNKETHHLKDLANFILKKPNVINSLAMFIRPSYWLGPLCSLLDEWRWEDIHGESQPVYEEFGSVLLLVIASKRRLDLSTSDMGIQEGFVARYLKSEGAETALSNDSFNHLGDWIYAMYIAEGLSDEVTTTCSAQEFYLLVPNLLQQSMFAYQKGKLTIDGLKEGLEYFLEPFLLPSLVTAIEWASQDVKAGSIMNPVFNKSTDNKIHQTIQAMMSSEWSFQVGSGDFDKVATTYINLGEGSLLFALRSLIQAKGPDAALRHILATLSTDFPIALDVMATLICVEGRQLRDLLRLKFATLRDPLSVGAIVHLHRRVEAYASVLIVQDIGMEFVPLSNIDTANADLDGTQEQPVDDIDQVLNETAAMGSGLDQPDIPTDVTMDDFYGLQGDDNMGLGNLDDLDLDMF